MQAVEGWHRNPLARRTRQDMRRPFSWSCVPFKVVRERTTADNNGSTAIAPHADSYAAARGSMLIPQETQRLVRQARGGNMLDQYSAWLPMYARRRQIGAARNRCSVKCIFFVVFRDFANRVRHVAAHHIAST